MGLVVGISGATGIIYGARFLEVLKEKGVETHLIISSTAQKILVQETAYTVAKVRSSVREELHVNVVLFGPLDI